MFNHRVKGCLLALLIAFTGAVAGCGTNNSAGDTNKPAQPQLGVIDMQKMVKAHPKYNELNRLNQELNTLKAKVAAEQQATAAANAGPVSPAPTVSDSAAAGLVQALQADFKAKMAAKQAELGDKLNAKADAARQSAAGELDAYTKELDKDYQPQIFNIQLKLKTVQLSKEDMEALQNQLDAIQKERNAKIAAKQQELSGKMDAIMAPEKAAAEQQLNAYAQQLNGEMTAKQAAQQAAMAQAAANVAPAATTLPNPSGVRTDSEQQAAMKQQEINVLQDYIIKDIQDKVAKVAVERGLAAVITGYQVNVSAVDITDAVIAECNK